MNETSWVKETKKPTGYQYPPEKKNWAVPEASNLRVKHHHKHGKRIPHHKYMHAQVSEHPYRESAWNDKEYDHSDETTWQEETQNPSVPYDTTWNHQPHYGSYGPLVKKSFS